jgi:hypothetical protein
MTQVKLNLTLSSNMNGNFGELENATLDIAVIT